MQCEERLNKSTEPNKKVNLVSGWLIKRSQNLAVDDGILFMNTSLFGTSLEKVCSSIGLKNISLADLEEYPFYDVNDRLLTVRFKDSDQPVLLIFRNGKLRRVEYSSEYNEKISNLDGNIFVKKKNKLINKLGSPQFTEGVLNVEDPKRAVEWNNESYICRLSLRPMDNNGGYIEQYFQEPDTFRKYFKITNSFLNDNCTELLGKSKNEILKKFGYNEDDVMSSNFNDSGERYEYINYHFNDDKELEIVFVKDKVTYIYFYTPTDRYSSLLASANSKSWNYIADISTDDDVYFKVDNSVVFYINNVPSEANKIFHYYMLLE